MDYSQYVSGPLSVFAGGVAGALVRVVIAPPANRRMAVAHVIAGSLMALFVAPAVVDHWLRSDSIALQRGVALLIGIAGPLVAEIALKVIQRRGDRMANRLVDRVTGKENEE